MRYNCMARRHGKDKDGSECQRGDCYLQEIDGKGTTKHTVWHGTQHVLMDAVSHVHQLAHAALEALPKLHEQALLTGT